MATFTIYTASADLTTLNAIFNGVSMICSQTSLIWGFAMLASVWRIFHMTTAATLETTSGRAGAVLQRGSMSAILPFILAMLLTTPGLQSRVQIESTLNGKVTAIDNVPMAISLIPVAGSMMSTQVGSVVTTAYQAVGTNYPAISAQQNGFINPLKVLLSSRSAIMRLGSVDSEVRTIVAACFPSDAGMNYSDINQMVMNAGNTGAPASKTIDINGVNGTSLGALLYFASQNTTGIVNNLAPNDSTVYSCPDAAVKVASDITDAVNSAEFARVVQGAVNGMDQPVPGANYSINSLTTQYTALSTANTVTNTLAGGAGQAQTEILNLLFSELVSNNLNCLQADGTDKTNCEASMIQTTEIERHNIEAAANEVPMLKYSGSFGNYILALIIGLGPVIVMFMMFMGVDAGKCVKTAVHITVWPLLVMNVGAEIVNGMICISVADFMNAIRQGGYISQAETVAIYKELSLQIGTGSHIMASLPVLMSMIFALGESAALVSVAKEVQPESKETSRAGAPEAISAAPMVSQRSMAQLSMGDGFSDLSMSGARAAVSTSGQYGNLISEATAGMSKAITKQQTLSEGQTDLKTWQRAFEHRNYSGLGIDDATGESVRKAYESSLRTSTKTSTGEGAQGTRVNSNASQANGSLSLSGSAGASSATGLGGSASFGGSLGAQSQTSAQDSLQGTKSSSTNQDLDNSKALSKALAQELSHRATSTTGSQDAKTITNSLSKQQSYQKLLSESKSETDSTTEAIKASSGLIMATQNIGASEIAWQMKSNFDFAAYQTTQGMAFDRLPGSEKYKQQAERDMSAGATNQLLNDPEGREAVIRMSAATMLALDKDAPAPARLAATEFVTGAARAMNHIAYTPKVPQMHDFHISTSQHAGADKPLGTPQRAPETAHGSPHAGTAHPKTPVHHNDTPRPVHPPVISQIEFEKQTREIETGVGKEAAAIRTERDRQQRVLNKAGLDSKGAGTVRRTAANVVDNFDATSQNDAPNRVRIGTAEGEAAKNRR